MSMIDGLSLQERQYLANTIIEHLSVTVADTELYEMIDILDRYQDNPIFSEILETLMCVDDFERWCADTLEEREDSTVIDLDE